MPVSDDERRARLREAATFAESAPRSFAATDLMSEPTGGVRDRVRRRHGALPAAMSALLIVVATATVIVLQTRTSSPAASACTSTVHAEAFIGRGQISLAYVPSGFVLQSGNLYAVIGSTVYWHDPKTSAAIQIGNGPTSNPFDANLAAPYRSTPFDVDGHPGVLFDEPSAGFVEVAWRASFDRNLWVYGTGVSPTVVEDMARGTTYQGPTIESLPISPGRVVTRPAAITAALHAGASNPVEGAKLSSYAEVSQMLNARELDPLGDKAPESLLTNPVVPVWAVLSGGGSDLTIVDAANGAVEWNTPTNDDNGWFGALTDRAPGVAGCPGGSTARVPFGVLTRDEESYLVSLGSPVTTPGWSVTMTDELVTSQSVAGMPYDSPCNDCPPMTVEWLVVRVGTDKSGAATCPWTGSVERGETLPKVRLYYQYSYGGSGGISCGSPPTWYAHVVDLAPPG
jgi:hypothetical protein